MKTANLPSSPLSFEAARAFYRLSPQAKHDFVLTLSDEEALCLRYTWGAWARDKQLEPSGNWTTWLLLAGRGFGKTRTSAEWVRSQVERGICGRLALVARTAADVRDVLIEGESGIMAISSPWFMPKYEPSKRRLTWPNGAVATTTNAADQSAGKVTDDLFDHRYDLREQSEPRINVLY